MGILCYLTVILIMLVFSLTHHMKNLLFSYLLSSHAVWETFHCFSGGVAGAGMEGFHSPDNREENECNTERRIAGKN